MSVHKKWQVLLLAATVALMLSIGSQQAIGKSLISEVSGVVKHVDKDAKTIVVKTEDGTEHTIKYTDKTVVEGAKDTEKGAKKASAETYLKSKEGAKVTVRYTEKGAKKTAVAVKDAVD